MSHPNIRTLVENEDHNIENSVTKFIVISLNHMHIYTLCYYDVDMYTLDGILYQSHIYNN